MHWGGVATEVAVSVADEFLAAHVDGDERMTRSVAAFSTASFRRSWLAVRTTGTRENSCPVTPASRLSGFSSTTAPVPASVASTTSGSVWRMDSKSSATHTTPSAVVASGSGH